ARPFCGRGRLRSFRHPRPRHLPAAPPVRHRHAPCLRQRHPRPRGRRAHRRHPRPRRPRPRLARTSAV
ncbi:MAG: N-acyl-D-amino-acid deacylase, partial [uncultured Chloroflexi bacterium]